MFAYTHHIFAFFISYYRILLLYVKSLLGPRGKPETLLHGLIIVTGVSRFSVCPARPVNDLI